MLIHQAVEDLIVNGISRFKSIHTLKLMDPSLLVGIMNHFKFFNFSFLRKLSFSFIFTQPNNELLLRLIENSPILKKIKIYSVNASEIIIDDLILAIDEIFNHR